MIIKVTLTRYAWPLPQNFFSDFKTQLVRKLPRLNDAQYDGDAVPMNDGYGNIVNPRLSLLYAHCDLFFV